jgi:hypothetical protein
MLDGYVHAICMAPTAEDMELNAAKAEERCYSMDISRVVSVHMQGR